MSRIVTRTLLAAVAAGLAVWAAAQGTDVNIHIHAGPAHALRAIPAHVVVPQARAFAVDHTAAKIEVAHVTVGVVIVEQTATTTMDVELRNPSSARIEAEVMVPVPEGAVVRSFTFQGTASEPSAELLPKDAALATYRSIVARMLDPAILEFAGCNLVRSSVFPVEPRGTQKVRLTYEHLLPADGNRVDYVLPRTESIDYRVPWEVSVKITARRSISTVFSPSHKVDFRRTDRHAAQVRIGREALQEPGPLQLSILREAGDGVSASLFACPDAKVDGGYFLLLAGLPGEKPKDDRPTPRREVTVVIDRSGSMAGEKLKQAQAAALQVIEGLDNGEAMNIVDFSDSLSSFAPKPVLKDSRTAEEARHYIRRLRAGGGTNIHDALAEALRPAPREGMLPLVLFLTDGLPTVGVRDEATIRDTARKLNVHHRRIFTFGVGFDVNAPLLSHLAQNSRAQSTFVLPNEDIEVKVSQIYRRLTGPVLSDPELKLLDDDGPGGRRIHDLVPSVMPDLFEGDQLVVLGKYRGERPLHFRLSGQYRGRPRSFEFTFPLDSASVRSSFVSRLWASRKIAMLVDEIRQAGASPDSRWRSSVTVDPRISDPRIKELVDEIVRLSTEFGILTEYTAFLAREGTDLNRRNEILEEANRNFMTRAQATRSGMGAVNQALNVGYQQAQVSQNRRNEFYDQNLNRVEISRVQQVADRALFQQGNRWVDSAALDSRNGTQPDRTVTVGSPEFMHLLDRLIAQNRQGVLAAGGEIVLRVDGENVLIRGE